VLACVHLVTSLVSALLPPHITCSSQRSFISASTHTSADLPIVPSLPGFQRLHTLIAVPPPHLHTPSAILPNVPHLLVRVFTRFPSFFLTQLYFRTYAHLWPIFLLCPSLFTFQCLHALITIPSPCLPYAYCHSLYRSSISVSTHASGRSSYRAPPFMASCIYTACRTIPLSAHAYRRSS
jgi:hypothetical protein